MTYKDDSVVSAMMMTPLGLGVVRMGAEVASGTSRSSETDCFLGTSHASWCFSSGSGCFQGFISLLDSWI